MKNTYIPTLSRWLTFLAVCLFLSGCKTYHPQTEAEAAMMGSENVVVSESSTGIHFDPQLPNKTGFIFYPGANVKPAAYAPLMLRLAEHGYTGIIAKFPLNLAILATNKADNIRASYGSNIDRWVMGGHSLGGTMAARYIRHHEQDGELTGLVLFAAYPANTDDLSLQTISVLSLYASEDGLSTPQNILNTQFLLPPTTLFFEILGGNHAQFGWYGEQNGDNSASIDQATQQQIILEQLLMFLTTL